MLKSIAWYLVIGGMVFTLQTFAFAVYAVWKYKFDFKKARQWSDVFGKIHDGPWISFGKKIGLSIKGINAVELFAYIITWPYAACVAAYSAVLATREFGRRLKEEP